MIELAPEVPMIRGSARLRAALVMTRPWNWSRMQVPATVLGILGGLHAKGTTLAQLPGALARDLWAVVGSIVTVSCLSAAGYVINDYFDQDIDAVNEPGRPIPSGMVSSRAALALAVLLFAGGLGSSLLIGALNVGIAALWIVFAVWYAASLKRSGYGTQSLAFGVIMGLTVLFGSASILHALSHLPAVLVAVFMSLFITALHMTGTLKDIEGDAKGGCKTAAIVLGEARTRTLVPIVYLASFLVLLYAAWVSLATGPLLTLVLGGLVLVITWVNVAATQSGAHGAIVRAHGLSKTLLYAIFLVLMVRFTVGG